MKSERIKLTFDKPRILVCGDVHAPFEDRAKLKEFFKFAKDFKPNVVIQIGDMLDLYTFSRFAKSVDLITPKQELEKGREVAADFWRTIGSLCPSATKWQMRGNHSQRIVKNLMAKAPEYESLLEAPISSLLEFPGVRNMKSSRSELLINDTLFIHGWSCKPLFHTRYFGQSVCHGHTHHGGVDFLAHKGKALFELDCGHVADVDQLPLQYGETKTSNWVAGFGYIDNLGPRFISL